MGTVVQLCNGSFTMKFKSLYKQAKNRQDFLDLLKWVIGYYTNPKNEKEHPLFAFLSVIYYSCPESFFDYVKDYDSLEREFMVTAKVMFEEDYIDKELINKWHYEILGTNPLFNAQKIKSETE